MSAEAEISALLLRASNAAHALANDSSQLVNDSIAALGGHLDLPGGHHVRPEGLDWDPFGGSNVFNNNANNDTPFGSGNPFDNSDNNNGTPSNSRNNLIGFPPFPVVELGTPPPPIGVDIIPGWEDVPWGGIDIPEFDRYPTVSELAPFTGAPPPFDTTLDLPPTPDTDVSFEPDFLPFYSIEPPEFVPPTTELTDINVILELDPSIFPNALSAIKTEIIGALDPLLEQLKQESEKTLDALLPALLGYLNQRFKDYTKPVLAFHSELEERRDKRFDEETKRIKNAVVDRSGWERPVLAQRAIDKVVDTVARAWVTQTKSLNETKSLEISIEVLETCGDVFDSLQRGINALKTKELEYILESHQFAVAYAKKAINALLAQFEAYQITRQRAEMAKSEAKIAAFDAELKVAALQYEVAQAKMEAEKAKQQVDENELQIFQIRMEELGKNVELYVAKASAARSELELRKIPIEVFELKLKAYDAQINVHEAKISARLAEIEGDSAKVDGQLMKVQAYEAQIKAYEAEINAKQATLSSKIQKNEGLLDTYKAEAKASLMLAEQSMLLTKYDFAKYEVIADRVIAEAQNIAKQAQIALDYETNLQDGVIRAYEATDSMNSEAVQMELNRLKSIAEVNAQGAQIMGSMSEGAMSAASGVASAIISES